MILYRHEFRWGVLGHNVCKKSLKIPGVIRIRKLKKDRQHNDKKKKDRQHNDQTKKDRQYNDKKDKQLSTKHYTQN